MRLWRRPQPPPLDLSPYANQWVAVKDGQVISHADLAVQIIENLRQMGYRARGSTVFYHLVVTREEPNRG